MSRSPRPCRPSRVAAADDHKAGVPVAVLTPPPADGTEITELYACLRGTVIIPADIDLTDPVIAEPFSAAEGKIHQ